MRGSWLTIVSILGLAAPAVAASTSFDGSWSQLAEAHRVFAVKAATSSGRAEAEAIDAAAPMRALHVPAMLERADLEATVEAQLGELEACAAMPEPFVGRAILDIVVRRTGRVAEVSLRPEGLRETKTGACVLRVVGRWRFASFTGETEPGLTHEAVSASFPLRFVP